MPGSCAWWLKSSPGEIVSRAGRLRILLFDSCTPAAAFEATLHCAKPHLDVVIFDTTCFSSGSGRIRQGLSWALPLEVPLLLIPRLPKLHSFRLDSPPLPSHTLLSCT